MNMAPKETPKMNKKIQIIVACHKPYWRSEEPMYRYIEVGTALRRRPMDGYLHDNTGSHSSPKNESFCELTGLYCESCAEAEDDRPSKNPAFHFGRRGNLILWLSTCHRPDRRRQRRLRQRRGRAYRPPGSRWSARRRQWRRHFPGWNG